MSIVLADHDETVRLGLAARFAAAGFEVLQAWDGPSFKRALKQAHVRIVVMGLEIPDANPWGLIARIRKTTPSIPVLLLANGSPPKKVARALRLGVHGCFRKPLDLEKVTQSVKEILALAAASPSETPRAGSEQAPSSPDAIWSPATQGVYENLLRAAKSDATILITGETGTGKEVAARAMHALSKRREKSLLCVNCAALSAGLLESELFGHEKGAFTGADRMRDGRFSLAHGGTLILDEIGELHLDLQSKLLRVLQTRAFERVGSSQTIQVDVRVMATTNRDLEADVARGRFRADLYFRLNVLNVHMPPLRERLSEVTLFLEHFLKKGGRESSRFAPEALETLKRYSWPGNIRELENLVESLLTIENSHRVEIDHLPLRIREACGSRMREAGSTPLSLERLLEEAERRHIREVLDLVSWNQRRAAEILKIGRNRLARKMREYELQPPVPVVSGS